MNNSSKQEHTHTSIPDNSDQSVAHFSQNEVDESSSLIATTAATTSTNWNDQDLINKSSKRGSSNDNTKTTKNYGSTSRQSIEHNNADVILGGEIMDEDQHVHVISEHHHIAMVSHHHEHHDHDHAAMLCEQHSALRSFLLLIALSFHSVFEGLAIGLQQESTELFTLFLAVIAHKGIMAFSLGLNLAQSAGVTVKKFILAIIIFSTSSPLGMAIGMAMSNLNQNLTTDIANGVLQGIAGGTFLYITFFEVLPHEFTGVTKHRLPKVACVILGYSAFCGVLILAH